MEAVLSAGTNGKVDKSTTGSVLVATLCKQTIAHTSIMQHKQIIFAEPRRRNIIPLVIDWIILMSSALGTIGCAVMAALLFHSTCKAKKHLWTIYAGATFCNAIAFVVCVMLVSGPISSKKSIIGTGVGTAGMMFAIGAGVVALLVYGPLISASYLVPLVFWGIVTWILTFPHDDLAQNLLPYPPYS